VCELIKKISLSDHRSQGDESDIHRKRGLIDLHIHDAMLESNKLLGIHIETISKKLEEMKLAQLSSNG